MCYVLHMKVNINTRKVTLVLSVAILVLSVLHLITNYLLLYTHTGKAATWTLELFDMAREVSVPTWYSQTIIFIASAVLLVIARIKKANRDQYYKHWLGLSIGFLYLSIDEGSGIHEIFNPVVKSMFGDLDIFHGIFYYAWTLAGLLVAGVVALVYLRFLLKLNTKTRTLFILAALIYLGGAIGLEIISSAYITANPHGYTYVVIQMIEESMEKFGVVLFIYALLDYLRVLRPYIGLRLQ